MVLPQRKVAEPQGAPPAHLKKKTMIKDQIGTVRTAAYDLPHNPHHVYGKADVKDVDDASVIMSGWLASNPSQPKESQRSFIKTNRMAMEQGCITAKQQREYAVAHPNIRFKQPTGKSSESKKVEVPFKGPYGAIQKGDAQSIRRLIECNYVDWAADGTDYPDMSSLEQKRRMKKPQPTKASEGHDFRNKQKKEPDHAPFKMKKFENVQSRIHYH